MSLKFIIGLLIIGLGLCVTEVRAMRPIAPNRIKVNNRVNISLGGNILSWTAPTTNTDGTPLTDLAGYRVYWGQVSGIYTNVQDVGMVTSINLSGLIGLGVGVTYFAVTAYDSAGNESNYSNEVFK